MIKIPWHDLLVEIHGGGMSWVGLARHLQAHDRQVERFALTGKFMTLTYERGSVILRFYAAIYPDRFKAKIAPLALHPSDIIPTEEAIGRIFR